MVKDDTSPALAADKPAEVAERLLKGEVVDPLKSGLVDTAVCQEIASEVPVAPPPPVVPRQPARPLAAGEADSPTPSVAAAPPPTDGPQNGKVQAQHPRRAPPPPPPAPPRGDVGFPVAPPSLATKDSASSEPQPLIVSPGLPLSQRAVKAAKCLETSVLTFRRASDIEATAVEWLWDGRIPMGKITLIAGHPDVGKSQLTAMLAAAVSRGFSLPHSSAIVCGSAIILASEDDAGDTIRPRLQAAGADLDRVHIFDGTPFDLCANLEILEAYLHKCGDVRLLVIDPVAAFLPTVNLGDGHAVRLATQDLKAFALRNDIALVLVHHLRKTAGGQALHGVSGAVPLSAIARSALLVARDPRPQPGLPDGPQG